jgi:hypothetical protein
LVNTPKKKTKFEVLFKNKKEDSKNNEKSLTNEMSLKLSIRCRDSILNMQDVEEIPQNKENKTPNVANVKKQKRKTRIVKLHLKNSWFNTEKTINKDICEIIKRIYNYYTHLFDQKFSVIEDFKKIRIFTLKDRLNFLHKR